MARIGAHSLRVFRRCHRVGAAHSLMVYRRWPLEHDQWLNDHPASELLLFAFTAAVFLGAYSTLMWICALPFGS